MTNRFISSRSRRDFLKQSSSTAAAIAAFAQAPAVWSASHKPNDVVNVGHAGIGVRGSQLVTDVAGEPAKDRPGTPGAQVIAICDVYEPHLQTGLKLSANPKAKAYKHFEEMLNDKDIDAVVISTPDHQHSSMLMAAANAGKDIYIEKCWTRTVPEAKKMLKAIKDNNTVMQLGHQQRASTAALQARDVVQSGILGEITFVRTGCFRNRPRSKAEWRWYGGYSQYQRPDESDVRNNLDWKAWLGDAPLNPFTMERFWHWRCYWDYGTGIAGDLQSHAFDFANHVIRLGIPESATTSGFNNLLKDGREAPDTWNTVLEYPSRGLSLLFSSTFNSMNMGLNTDDLEIRGKDALLKVTQTGYNAYPESTSERYQADLESGKLSEDEPMKSFDPEATPEQPTHMEDFIQCVHTRNKPKCNEDEAFVEAVTCIMSVIAYEHKETVYWDSDKQEVVNKEGKKRSFG